MALPSSGSISLGQVNTELGVSATATRSLNDATTRSLFGVSSGAISLSNGYGKANEFAFTISSTQTNANLSSLATTAGWNGSSKVVVTINSGLYITSNSTSTPALTVSGFPSGVKIINNGIIVGHGGNGGNGGSGYTPVDGSPGGNAGGAILVSSPTEIENNNTIAGGGGGGGGGGAAYKYDAGYNVYTRYAGGGGGGGRTGLTNTSGGSPGGYNVAVGGSSGGGGSVSSAGSGGAGSGYSYYNRARGGDGGGWGSNGNAGQYGITFTATGNGGAGGSGGYAVSGNSNVTWLATGTRNGSLI